MELLGIGVISSMDKKCISCGSKLEDDIVTIGNQYPSAIFSSERNKVEGEIVPSSLNVTRCSNETCGLVQLVNKYDLQYVFDHYPYESNSTATMKQILQDVVNSTKSIVSLTEEDVVLDIGGNDGTLLEFIDQLVRARVNIDAAAGVNQLISSSDYHYVHSKFKASAYKDLKLPNPKLIFSIAMFYHLNDPVTFCKEVKEIMSDDSVWVIQLTYLGTMLRDNIFDNIVHEHAAYYSLKSLESMLLNIGLYIVDAKIVKSYGGSLRVFVVKDPSKFSKDQIYKNTVDVVQFELDNKTNTIEELKAFNSRTQSLKHTINDIIDHIVYEHGPMWGFGASTKGNMILQFLGIKEDKMSIILDNNRKKMGKWTTGSSIPIVIESVYLRSIIGHKYLFVLPYYYTDAFVKIIEKYLHVGNKVSLLIPLPYPYFIEVKGLNE